MEVTVKSNDFLGGGDLVSLTQTHKAPSGSVMIPNLT